MDFYHFERIEFKCKMGHWPKPVLYDFIWKSLWLRITICFTSSTSIKWLDALWWESAPRSKGIIQRNKRQLLFLCCKGHSAQIHQWLSLLQRLGGLNASLHGYWSLCKVSAEWFCCMKQPCIFKDALESRLDGRHSSILQTLIIAIAPLTNCHFLRTTSPIGDLRCLGSSCA